MAVNRRRATQTCRDPWHGDRGQGQAQGQLSWSLWHWPGRPLAGQEKLPYCCQEAAVLPRLDFQLPPGPSPPQAAPLDAVTQTVTITSQ